jgi:hypothetical protein
MRILAFIFIAAVLVSCNSGNDKTSSAAPPHPQKEGVFGAEISGKDPVSGEELIQMMNNSDSVYVTFKSEILAACQVSGCWMDLDLGNEQQIKVTFKDYEFFIPLESKGKTATIEGYAKKEVIPVDLLRHYAEDDGKSQEEIDAITEPEMAYVFEAVGVIIED